MAQDYWACHEKAVVMVMQAASFPWDHNFALGCSWERSSNINPYDSSFSSDSSFLSVLLQAPASSPLREATALCKLWEPQKVTSTYCEAGMKAKKLPQGEHVKKTEAGMKAKKLPQGEPVKKRPLVWTD